MFVSADRASVSASNSKNCFARSGSAEVWTVAKGTSSNEQHTAHLMKKVRKAATPEVEDSVLARLTETQYKEKNARLTELDNFLAVSSIDLHRKEPMDEESAESPRLDHLTRISTRAAIVALGLHLGRRIHVRDDDRTRVLRLPRT